MPFEQLPITETTMHPMNFATYTANTVPALEIQQDEAEFWAEMINETHVPVLNISTSEPLTIVEIISKYADFKWQEGVWNGEYIAGPLLMQIHQGDVENMDVKPMVSVNGICLYAPRQESNQGA